MKQLTSRQTNAAALAIAAVAAVVEFVLMFALELTDTLGLDRWRRGLCWAVLVFLTVSWGGIFVLCCLGAWSSFLEGDWGDGVQLSALAVIVAGVYVLCIRYYVKKLTGLRR